MKVFYLIAMVFSMCGLAFASNSAFAGAACLPGLPCTVPPVVDDPNNINELNTPHTNPLNVSKAFDSRVEDAVDPANTYTCDANFMNQIYAKGFLEAERDVIVGNSMIMKPDSVLEYTCFDKIASDTALIAGPVFSETTRWQNADVGGVSIDVFMGDDRLDTSIEQLVLEALKIYVDEQFEYDFLGGAAAGMNNTIQNTVTGGGGVCPAMFSVYYISKCDDFALQAPFVTFEEYFSSPALVSFDPRTLPDVCPNPHGITAEIIEVAKNRAWNYASFDAVLDTQLNITRGVNVSNSCENVDPIPTGVMVEFVEYGEDLAGNPIVITPPYQYEDKVCSNPGCYFDHNYNADPGDDLCKPRP